MNLESMEFNRARAYPVSDALQYPLTAVRNEQRVPQRSRLRLKKLVRGKEWKKKGKMRIGNWNVGSLTGKGRELIDVMQRRKIMILCIQETKWKGQSAKKLGEGYKVYYTGEDTRRNGVGIILHPDLHESVTDVQRISDRLMGLKFVKDKRVWHIVTAYAPQQGCSEEEKEDFWEKLEEYIEGIPRSELLVLSGDMNAHVGESSDGFEGIHGGRGFGRRNQEGDRFLEFAEAMDLVVLNTQFKKRRSHLVTYKSGQNETQIDYILVRKEDKKIIMDCKVIPNESVVAQHKLVVADVRKKAIKKSKPPARNKRIKTWKLKGEKAIEFRNKVERIREERYVNGIPESPEEIWVDMKEIVVPAAAEVCGRTSGNGHQEKETWWWNQDVQTAGEEKGIARRKWEEDSNHQTREEYRRAKRVAKRMVAIARREANSEWYEMMGTPEGEKMIYKIAESRKRSRQDVGEVGIIKDENGNILIEEEKVKRRWKEYFSQLLNSENECEDLENIPPVEGQIANISENEVENAIKKGKANKAAGKSEVTIEMIKALGNLGKEWVYVLLEKIWDLEEMPRDWNDSWMIKMYKQKGDVLDCGNYRGIKLLEHVFKILERVVEGRLRDLIDIHEQQFGFMKGKSTVDAIFIVRQVQEKYLEGNRKVYMCFVDLEKAYDRVPRRVVYWCLRKRGVPEKLVRIVKMMYEGARTTVRTKYGETEAFPVEVGLHQGSALSPFLFLVVIDTLTRELRDNELWELLFADDLVIIADTEEEVQERFSMWKRALEQKGLKVNLGKTELMVSCKGGQEEVNIRLEDGTELKQSREFKYLGSVLAEEGGTEKAVRQRVREAWRKWREVTGVILDKKLQLKLKMKVYKTVIRPVLLYGAETWSLKRKEEGLLERTEMRMVRWIAGISLLERRESHDIRRMCGVCNVVEKAREARLRYYGHVVRREEEEPVKRAMGMPVVGRRSVGRQRIRWTDVIRRDMGEVGLEEGDARDRKKWRKLTRAADPAIQWD